MVGIEKDPTSDSAAAAAAPAPAPAPAQVRIGINLLSEPICSQDFTSSTDQVEFTYEMVQYTIEATGIGKKIVGYISVRLAS